MVNPMPRKSADKKATPADTIELLAAGGVESVVPELSALELFNQQLPRP